MIILWLKGLVLGFSIAAPVGPIGLLCIRRSLAEGRLAGLLSGLGAATADAIYGCVAAFGLTAVFSLLTGLQFWLQLGGGLFLLWLGWRTLRSAPARKEAAVNPGRGGYTGMVASTFLLTLSNPMTIFSFLAIFSGAGLAEVSGSQGWRALVMVGGVFCGSALWWLLLSNGIAFLGGRLNEQANQTILQWVNRLAGLGLMGFAVYTLMLLLK
jgi:threonine/homoserine/homoserine lactone efflux protein